jgi:HAD superfamily hydrolase (TIGR01484 family)
VTTVPALVALDVDGTLVDGANQMTDAVREAVLAIQDAGAHVVISTGRSIQGVMDAVRKVGLTEGIAVASNGSVVFTYDATGAFEVVHEVTFDAREAVKVVLDHVPDAAVAVEEIGVGWRINKPFPDGEINGRMTEQTIDELVESPVTRVIVRSPESTPEDFTVMAEQLGLAGTNYFVGYTAWLDLAPEGVSKASGLEVVCERLGVARADVVAIGDGHNDVEMLRWAGRGVAMGESPQDVLDAADVVTATLEDDGTAVELRRYLS